MQVWTEIKTTLEEIKQALRDRTNSLLTNFSGSSLPGTNIYTGMTAFLTGTNTFYYRDAASYIPINRVIEDKLHYKNLIIKNNATTPATKIDIKADFISCQGYTSTSFNTTIDATTTGANALDSGSLTSDDFYYVWIIAAPGSTEPKGQSPAFAGLLSTSATNPVLPSGYTKKARIGSIRTLSTAAQLRRFTQIGNVFYYTDYDLTTVASASNNGMLIVNDGTDTSWTQISQSAMQILIPYESSAYIPREILLYCTTAGDTTKLDVADTASPTYGMRILSGADTTGVTVRVPIDETNGLYYKIARTSTGTTDIACVGYIDSI